MPRRKPRKTSLTKTFMKRAALSTLLATSAISTSHANENNPEPMTTSQEQPHMIIIYHGGKKAEISWSQPDEKNWNALFDGTLSHSFNMSSHNAGYETAFVGHWKNARNRENELPRYNGEHKGLKEFHTYLERLKDKNSIQQLRDINRYVNNMIASADDEDLYKSIEYYASAYETTKNKQGDCDDYTLAKFYALEYLGFDQKHMRLAILDAYKLPSSKEDGSYEFQGHAALFVNTHQGIFILDNRFNEMYQAKFSDEYQILYTMNDQKLWVYDTANENRRIQNRNKPKRPKSTK